MAKKKTDHYGIDDIEEIAADAGKQVAKSASNLKKMGRPKKNPYDADHKLTYNVPDDIYRLLNIAAGYTGKPKGQIVIDALKEYLKEYEGR